MLNLYLLYLLLFPYLDCLIYLSLLKILLPYSIIQFFYIVGLLRSWLATRLRSWLATRRSRLRGLRLPSSLPRGTVTSCNLSSFGFGKGFWPRHGVPVN